MKKFLIISLVLLLGFSLAIGGCAINRKPAPPQEKNQGTETPAPSPSQIQLLRHLESLR